VLLPKPRTYIKEKPSLTSIILSSKKSMQILPKDFLLASIQIINLHFLRKLYQDYIPVYILGGEPLLQIGQKVEIFDDAGPSFDNIRVLSCFLR